MLRVLILALGLGLVLYVAVKLFRFIRPRIGSFLKYFWYFFPMILPFLRGIKWRWLFEILRKFLQKP